MSERILLGVTGSIAAYKAPFILRRLRERGFEVPVVMTEAASRFIGRVTFEALTSAGVYDDLWARREALSHISLLDGTKLILVAPSTANIIAKAATGIADDLLSSLLLAAETKKVIYAPAMNEGMWNNPATQYNVGKLIDRGSSFIEPASGELACGVTGRGRLAEIEDIVLAAERAVRADPVLAGKKIIVTCGRTEEELDPVRVITNRSSGRTGTAIARGFMRAGADVTMVTGQVSVPLPRGARAIRTFSASAMLEELKKLIKDADALIMTAAIADYKTKDNSNQKIKGNRLAVELEKTPDILASLPSSAAVRIGFSVETGDDWTATAKAKLDAKRLDAIVANPAGVIGNDLTEAYILFASGRYLRSQTITKQMLAEKLVEVTRDLLKERDG